MEELGEITQHLLRFSPDALLVVDGEGRIRFANETLTQLFGYAAANLLGQRMEILLPERLRGAHHQHFSSYASNPLAREMGARITDLFGRRADGSEFPAGIRLAPFRIGSRLFVAAAIRDMTERRRINEALIAAREEADRANRAKSRFLATASHDLRQPLQTIRLLNAAMLKVPRPELRDILQQQAQAIDSMIRLLNSLLDISRLEAGAITPELVPVDLEEILEDLRMEFHTLAQARGLELHIVPVKTVVQTDRILFHQLLQNLVGNALKYTDRGHVSVNCVLGNDTLTINVDDTGIGIPADKLDRIFDEYYQVDTHGTKRMGVGLGLAIVREVAQLLKFTVTIAGGQGGGTRASVSIPRQFLTNVSPVLEPTVVASAPVTENLPRIVLVEDNDAVRVATELFLKFEGFEVMSAASAEDAQRLFASVRPSDVVITDYHLDADNTGLDLLKALRRQQGAEIPGIILTGDLPSLLRRSGTTLPSCRLLPKPVDTLALIHAINELSAKAREAQAATTTG
ncbi:MAG: ATP-binding protein [Steroidobacteraceae bacterium]